MCTRIHSSPLQIPPVSRPSRDTVFFTVHVPDLLPSPEYPFLPVPGRTRPRGENQLESQNCHLVVGPVEKGPTPHVSKDYSSPGPRSDGRGSCPKNGWWRERVVVVFTVPTPVQPPHPSPRVPKTLHFSYRRRFLKSMYLSRND